MAPIKIKLSLSSASIPSASGSSAQVASQSQENNTPKRGNKAPQHARTGLPSHHAQLATPEAGPSRLRGDPPGTISPAVFAQTPLKNGVHTPSSDVSTPSGLPSAANTPSSSKSKSKSKAKAKPAKKTKRPTAIPSHLLPSTPSTPKPSPPLPLHGTPSPGFEVKQEDVEKQPSTPHAGSPSVEPESMNTPGDALEVDEAGTPTTAQKQSVRWMRIKRPLREHATKIVTDLIKRDEYDLFGQPVDLEAYPDYLGIVGGEDKLMDLGTIQGKIDNEEYRSMDEFQADLEMIATAAKNFNPVGTIPHNAAIKMYNQGVKQIDRIRDLVLTPHPSRAGSANNWRDGSVTSGREATAGLDDGQPRSSKADIPPPSYIPEEMLAYPPNSGAAKMVGWNFNGGKRVYLKKITRGRERFTGKWRMWDLDGTRDVAEMDDPELYFDAEKAPTGSKSRSIVNWPELRWERWWDYEGLGGPNGQPPLPGTPLPKRPTALERPLTTFDWGVYPDIDLEMAAIGKRSNVQDETAILYNHLNAVRVKTSPSVPHNFVNLFEEPQNRQPIDYMREFATGDVTGEAYTRSIDRFIQGAIAGRTKSANSKPDSDAVSLKEYVEENYGYGILSKDFEQRPVVRNTLMRGIKMADGKHITDEHEEGDYTDIDKMARASFARTALRQMTRHINALDIVPLIRIPGEFTWQGIGGKGDIDIGLKWVAEYQVKAQKEMDEQNGKRKRASSPDMDIRKKSRIEDATSAASSPLSAAPGSPVKESQAMGPTTFNSTLDLNDGENGLKRIRLELLALTKFYPLAALRKMDKSQAEKLLPPNVRALMTNTAKR